MVQLAILVNQSAALNLALLYHELCENYPLNALKLRTILLRHNVPEHFSEQCLGMVSELFNKTVIS